MALLNFSDHDARVRLVGGRVLDLPPYSIMLATSW
jgi:hypothetical protein